LVNNGFVNHGWPTAKIDYADDLRGVLHCSEIVGQIQAREKIAGEEGANNPAFDATDGFEALEPWIIGVQSEDLAAVLFGALLAARACMDAEPPSDIGQGIAPDGVLTMYRNVVHHVNHHANRVVCTVRSTRRKPSPYVHTGWRGFDRCSQ
jgi:hypothetical protein